MLTSRLIPVMTIADGAVVKTTQFSKPIYIGDPINTARIWNDMHVDELIILDITATKKRTKPDVHLIKNIAEECRMPVCYGGGITSLSDIREILKAGVEKVALNTAAILNPTLVNDAVKEFGSSCIVLSVDVRKTDFGDYAIYSHSGSNKEAYVLKDYVQDMVSRGIGEIVLTSIDRDGTQTGYDLNLIDIISNAIDIPLIACGGAANIKDCIDAISSGASAVAAGSMLVFKGKHKAVLVNYPRFD